MPGAAPRDAGNSASPASAALLERKAHQHVGSVGSERGTRGQVARLILELGPSTAATLGSRLGLTPAAIRRHLDNLISEGLIETRTARTYGNRGRGRPAKLFVITDAGRSAFEHAYDDLATGALRFIAADAGPGGRRRVRPAAGLRARAPLRAVWPRVRFTSGCRRYAGRCPPTATPRRRAARRRSAPRPAAGEQICQHHCPVAHVAAEFPQLCEAETEAFGRLLGTPVQRLATIAHGDGICTTHVTSADPRGPRGAAKADNDTPESGGLSL